MKAKKKEDNCDIHIGVRMTKKMAARLDAERIKYDLPRAVFIKMILGRYFSELESPVK